MDFFTGSEDDVLSLESLGTGRSGDASCPTQTGFNAFAFLAFILLTIDTIMNINNNINNNNNNNNNNDRYVDNIYSSYVYVEFIEITATNKQNNNHNRKYLGTITITTCMRA